MIDKIPHSSPLEPGEAPHPVETTTYAFGDVRPSRPALWMGVYLGAFLNIAMIAALVAANRFPKLEPYALERNAGSYGLFVVLLLIPVVWFIKRPAQMFVAGIIGWVLFVAGYDIAGFYFRNLFEVL